MLAWVRNRSARVAGVLLLSLLTATASEARPSHAEAGHDDHSLGATQPIGVHDEADHELRSPTAPDSSHPLHCLVCHWARAFRPLSTPSAGITPTLEARYHRQPAVIAAPRGVAPPQLSLRSPPSSPFVV